MEEGKLESHATSAAAFVEGGILEACDDSCSICLEAFCDSDPCTVTSCKHEFHLHCILEWCQRSSECPMCWQPISLKDPASQELLDAVEKERCLRLNPGRNSSIFHHPNLGDFELQHLPLGVNYDELEDRIIQHLAAAAAMGRTRHVFQREGSRIRSSAHSHPHVLVLSTHPEDSPVPVGGVHEPISGPSETNQQAAMSPTTPMRINRQRSSIGSRSSTSQSSSPTLGRSGPSDFQSVSDSWKSRFNAISMRYRESISKSTRGLKERLFSRTPSVVDNGSEIRRNLNTGTYNLSHLMECLEARESNRQHGSTNLLVSSVEVEGNRNIVETHHETH